MLETYERNTSGKAAGTEAMTSIELNSIVLGDCIQGMNKLAAGSVDLAFADPPFNIGYKYDVYDDRRERDQYLDWSRHWIAAVHRVLKPDGTFWLAIGDEYAAELKVLSQEVGFHPRSWVIWYYTFGVNCDNKFTRSHVHLFYFVKDPEKFTFRSDLPENRVPSARQLVYNDARGNPKGRLPDDTWILRPQDLPNGFTADEDTWYIPRVAGTFKERAGFHGCQMPEQLLGRIIRICSDKGELVLDPFSGSATTLAVAKKLGRRFVGFDLSADYAKRGKERLASIKVGDRLDGAPEPLMVKSAELRPNKSASSGKRLRHRHVIKALASSDKNEESRILDLRRQELIDAFSSVSDGYSVDRVVADQCLASAFAEQCRKRGLPGAERDWNHQLLNLRKTGKFPTIRASRVTALPWETFDKISFAIEIALERMLEAHADSLDEILCDPKLASEFDALSQQFAPGFDSLSYRWGALKLRKEAKNARLRAKSLNVGRFSRPVSIDELQVRDFPETSGLYVVATEHEKLYAGQALNLRYRIETCFTKTLIQAWQSLDPLAQCCLKVSYWCAPGDSKELLGYESRLIQKSKKPRYNFRELAGR